MNKVVAEGIIEKWILVELNKIKFTKEQVGQMINKVAEMKQLKALTIQDRKKALELQIGNIKAKIAKVMDLMLDNTITPETFNDKNKQLLLDLKSTEDQLKLNYADTDQAIKRTEELTKLLADPIYAYKKTDSSGKGKLVSSMMQDIKVYRDRIEFQWKEGFKIIG